MNPPAARFVALSAVHISLATAAVSLRVVSIRIRKRKWQAHDLLCILSFVCLPTLYGTNLLTLSWICLIAYAADLITGELQKYAGSRE